MFEKKREFTFMKYRKTYYIIAIAIIVVGIGFGLIRGYNFGIDFTGGTRFQINMGSEISVSELTKVLNANDVEAEIVQAGDNNEKVIIKTTQSLKSDARDKLLNDIYDKFDIPQKLKEQTSIEQFGPSVGDMLKANAVKGVIIACIGMLIYIMIRFEWKFGVAAIAATIHDVLVLLAVYGFFHMPINNPFIAAVLTIVGYSIMDTVVIFDRVRENRIVMNKSKLEDLIDKSINQTLVRSLMTSICTVVAIIPLLILGGETIRSFTLPLIVGIIAGTGSSIFIASPLYFQLCQATGESSKYRANRKKKKIKE